MNRFEELKSLVPYDFSVGNIKDIKLTDDIYMAFDDISRSILDCGLEDTDKMKQHIEKSYINIKESIIDIIRSFGDSKAIHCKEEIEFIYICCYLLYYRFGFNQKESGKLFGLRPNEFEKLGISPVRDCNAYNHETVCMFPNGWGYYDEGSKIAEIINKKLIAQQSCDLVFVLDDDLDTFANIGIKKKKLFLSRGYSFDEEIADNLQKANYSYARYLFAISNRTNQYGRIKEKIIKLLELDDVSLFEDLVTELLSDDNISLYDCILNGQSVDEFVELRKKYVFAEETIDVCESYYDNYKQGHMLEGLEYDDIHLGALVDEDNIDDDKLKDVYSMINSNMLRNMSSTKEVVDFYYEKSKKELSDIKPVLIGMLDIKKIVSKYARKNYESSIELIKHQLLNETLNNPKEEDEITAAARYYIYQAFCKEKTSEEKEGKLVEYLSKKDLSKYVDAIERENTKARVFDYNYSSLLDINEIKDELNYRQKKNKPKFLIYIDSNAFSISDEDIKKVLDAQNCIVVSKGKRYSGFKELDRKNKLYVSLGY